MTETNLRNKLNTGIRFFFFCIYIYTRTLVGKLTIVVIRVGIVTVPPYPGLDKT